jgi:RimJ/RimL family protein N-acetyltransferase
MSDRAAPFPPPTLSTPRLLLRRPVLADADAIFERYATDPQVTRFMTWAPHADVGVTREWFEGAVLPAWETGRGERGYVICLHEDPRPIGMIGVRDHYGACLGYVLARPWWGRGLMAEAVRAVSDAALGQANIHRVWAFHDVDNVGSARVLEKAGFEREGVLRRWCIGPALGPEPRDCVCWSRVREEA